MKKNRRRGAVPVFYYFCVVQSQSMVTNLHFLRIRRDFLPQSLAEEMRKRAQAATEQGADVVFMYRYSPIAEQRSLINLDIPFKYTHKQTVQLSLF